jgi:branched-chain amino acid transport system permease protein
MLEWLQFVLAPQVINGLSIGVAVVLMALGLTIIFGLLDVINMAHGEFYAIGAYAALVLIGMGLPFWWALLLTPLLMAVVGYATERALIQRVFHSKDRHTLTLLLTFGIAIILEDLLKIVFECDFAQGPIRLRTKRI